MNGGPSPSLQPHPLYEVTLTVYDNHTVGWQATGLVGEVPDDQLRHLLITAARHIPQMRNSVPPPLPDRGIHERACL